ncbi:MAG: site-specific DNA-methyltransferase [Blastocatellia bacterium]|nr:site-specific DNA-methyltransferase [Blastocatellia bacterium]
MPNVKQAAANTVDTLFPDLKREPNTKAFDRADWGTFKDSLRAPIHRWFTYPAGFSYKAVEEAFRLYNIAPDRTVYDPFAGTGTTNLVAKQYGVHSFGVEAHPFVQFVGQTKLFWEFDLPSLLHAIDSLIEDIYRVTETSDIPAIAVEDLFPELVCKCYSREKLARLYICREMIDALQSAPFKDFAKLGLTNLLRTASDVAAGWPYVAPQKPKSEAKTNGSVDIVKMLRSQLYLMHNDLRVVREAYIPGARTIFIAGDSREYQSCIRSGSVDLAFTSPPYLNNYDYADRTRLETYFWGEAKTWADITERVRNRLMMSATTQINRSDYREASLLNQDFCQTVPQTAAELKPKVAELSERRLNKGGKKSYDIMVAGYFNDMLRVLRETYRVLKSGSAFVLILGDSAPYGVYIPTDEYLCETGKAVGFARYEIETLRTRGGKWKNNPQRHDVALKECILTLYKD